MSRFRLTECGYIAIRRNRGVILCDMQSLQVYRKG